MDEFNRRIMGEFQDMQRRMGRMLRCMSLPGVASLKSGTWMPAIDMYETDAEILIYVDVAGVDMENMEVTVDNNNVIIAGRRQLPARDEIRTIHQMEIDYGFFERTVHSPVPVKVSGVSSSCRKGILEIRLPIEKSKDTIRIKVG